MQKLKTLFVLMVTVSSIPFLASCSKEEGCTDRDAVNYNPEAEEDDGSCNFEGGVVFYYNEEVANALLNADVSSLTYYLDGQIIGSSAANVYWSGSSPDCDVSGLATSTRDLGRHTTQAYNYSVIDDQNRELWSGAVNINANSCQSIRLTI